MAFQMKILDKINCPRCNAIASLRLDQKHPKNDWIFIYIVCPTCKLSKYSHTIDKKELNLHKKRKKIEKSGISEDKKKIIFDRLK